MRSTSSSRRSLSMVVAALALGAAACGGGGGATADAAAEPEAPEAPAGPPACIQELIAIVQRDVVVAAARAGQGFPEEDRAAFEAVAADCEAELAVLTPETIEQLTTQIDPAVLQVIMNGSGAPPEVDGGPEP